MSDERGIYNFFFLPLVYTSTCRHDFHFVALTNTKAEYKFNLLQATTRLKPGKVSVEQERKEQRLVWASLG